MTNIFQSHIKKGIIIAVIILIFKAFLLATKNYYNDIFTYVGWSLLIVLVLISVYTFQSSLEEKLLFNGLLAHGLKTSAVLACISFVGMLIFTYFIFPNMAEEAVINVASHNKASISKADYKQEDFAIAKKIMTLTITAGSLMGNLILGFLGSLVGAILFGKK